MKIAVLTDSGTGFTQKEAQDLGLYYVPLQVLHNDTQYLDGINIDVRKVYDLMKEKQELTTSMPPLAFIEKTIAQMKEDGCDCVICVPISNGLSSTASIITAAVQAADMKLFVVDCYSTAYIQGYLAESAKKLVDQGLAAKTIVKRLEDAIHSSNTLIIPDDLQHLKRGGRLTPVAAALGGLLKIKPVLQLNKQSDGKIDVFDKVRTMSKAIQKAIDTFVYEDVGENYRMACLHADVEDMGKQFLTDLTTALPNRPVIFGTIAPVIAVHTGIGCLGIQYIKEVEGV